MGNIDKLKEIVSMVGKEQEAMNPDDVQIVMKLKDILNKKEALAVLEKMKDHALETRKSTEKQLATIKEAVDKALEQVQSKASDDVQSVKDELMAKFDKELTNLQFKNESLMSVIDKKLSEVQDGIDGMDADEEIIVQKVLALLPPKEELAEETPEDIKAKIVQITEGNWFDVKYIKGLEELVRQLAPARMGTLGGSVVHKFMDDETPSGTVNGVNDTFTLSKAPVNGSLKLFRGGARQRVTEDYTLSGRTIVFTIPPVVGEILLADYRYF
jgi:hypothetical protein